MAHHKDHAAFTRLTERLNRFPQGAPPSPLLEKILGILMSEREAELISLLPMRPFTADKAARSWQMSTTEAQHILDALSSRALLVDIVQSGQTEYVLPPPMAGFFEFSLMRTRDDINQELLSELFYQYLNVEDDFVRELFTEGATQLGRVFVQEATLPAEPTLQVLDYERASEIIRQASHMGISLCYCRHKMAHRHQACEAPLEICMTFNTSAASLVRHGHARSVEPAEGMELLEQACEHGLVQFGENVREGVNFICNCCGCCCEAMLAAKRFANLNPVHTTNYIADVADEYCSGCGACIVACPVEAMTLVSANAPKKPQQKRAKLDSSLCLGCGVCVRVCPQNTLTLTPRTSRVITPVNSAHRTVLMAIERGKLQHLIFDNRLLFSHRALATLFGVILKLPPVKRLLASNQLQSRYLETLITKM